MRVSKLFRAYGLYNVLQLKRESISLIVSKLFRAYGLYNNIKKIKKIKCLIVSKLFRAYGLYNRPEIYEKYFGGSGFKALSSLRVI